MNDISVKTQSREYLVYCLVFTGSQDKVNVCSDYAYLNYIVDMVVVTFRLKRGRGPDLSVSCFNFVSSFDTFLLSSELQI